MSRWLLAVLERPRGTTGRYGMAVLLVLIASGVAFGLYIVTGARFATVYVVGVILASWLGGLGPGLLFTALATLAISLVFVPPLGQLTLPSTATDITTFILFWIVSALISVIGERVRASADRLRSERDRLEQVLDVMPVAVEVADVDGMRYALNNAASRHLVGKQLAGEQVPIGEQQAFGSKHLNGEPLAAAELPLQRALLAGESVFGMEYTVVHPERGDVPVLANAAPVRASDGRTVTGAVAAYQDTSELKGLEKQKNQLLALLSHDLQQPLSGIRAQTQLLRRRIERGDGLATRETLTEGLQRIEQATAKLGDQLRELLDVARMQGTAESMGIRMVLTEVVSLLQEVILDAQRSTESHTVVFESDVPALEATMDPARVRRAMSNLLANALKYSPAATTVSARLRAPSPADPCLRIEIADQGQGIPAEDLPFIFEPFRRGSNVDASVPGTGLGLSGVQQIVQEHGGTIEVNSSAQTGTTFIVRLPMDGERLNGPMDPAKDRLGG